MRASKFAVFGSTSVVLLAILRWLEVNLMPSHLWLCISLIWQYLVFTVETTQLNDLRTMVLTMLSVGWTMDWLQFGGFRLANACVGHNRRPSVALLVAPLKCTATSKPQFARHKGFTLLLIKNTQHYCATTFILAAAIRLLVSTNPSTHFTSAWSRKAESQTVRSQS